MAHKKKRAARRKATARRNPANPPKRRRRVHHRRAVARRNPPSVARLVKRAPEFAITAARTAGGVLVGKTVARKVRGSFKKQPGTLVGSLVEVGVGLAAGLALAMAGLEADGLNVAAGGMLAAAETYIQNMGVKGVSDSLADDGYLYGTTHGTTLVPVASAPGLAAPSSVADGSVLIGAGASMPRAGVMVA